MNIKQLNSLILLTCIVFFLPSCAPLSWLKDKLGAKDQGGASSSEVLNDKSENL